MIEAIATKHHHPAAEPEGRADRRGKIAERDQAQPLPLCSDPPG